MMVYICPGLLKKSEKKVKDFFKMQTKINASYRLWWSDLCPKNTKTHARARERGERGRGRGRGGVGRGERMECVCVSVGERVVPLRERESE
jgi:hypothetical protein